MTIKNTSLQKFHFGVVDENNNPIESGLRVSVFIAGSTAATVYADAYETAMTNPVTETVYDAAAGGISFWYGAPTCDVVINDALGRLVKVESLTPSQNKIVFDSRQAVGGVLNNITGTDLADDEGVFVAYAESVTIAGDLLRAGDVIHIFGQVIADDIHAASAELAIQVLFGAEVILQTGDVTFTANEDAITFDCMVKVLVAGTSGTIMFWGDAKKQLSGVVSAAPCASPTGICGLAGNTEDMSGDVAISVKGDYENAHADQESQAFIHVQVLKGVVV